MRKMCLLSVAVSAILFAGTVMPGADARAQSTGPVSVTQNGTTLVAPNVRCSGDPVASLTPITTGIAIRASNVTVINPRVENCQRGIAIYRNSRGGVVQKVRIIADASLAGYEQTELRHNRESLYIERVKGGEFGDITSSQLGKDGGQLRVNDTYRFVHALGSQDFRIHDFAGDCSGGVASNWGSSAPAGMCHWGIKWLSDRPTGAPYKVSNNVVRDIDVSGVDDESISMDGRYDVPARSAVVGTDTVASRKPYSRRLELSSSGWSNLSENLTNQYVQIVSGPYQGEYVRITSRSGSTFTVDDATGLLSRIAPGTRVSVGMLYMNNRFESNRIHSDSGKVHIDTHGVGSHTQVRNNVLTGRNEFTYKSVFHYRDGGRAPQCVDVRTISIGNAQVGGAKIGLSANSSVTGNSCALGDISHTVVTWAAPPSGLRMNSYWASNKLDSGSHVSHLTSTSPPAAP